MNHPFECKYLGKISDPLLSELKLLALSQKYKKPYAWDLEQSDLLAASESEISSVIQELNAFLKVKSFCSASFSLLRKMTYGPEHSDTWIKELPTENCKLHIPVITNSGVGFMWPGYDVQRSAFVTTMQEGHIYIFNNVAKHSVVNLSQQDRYHLLMEFECVE